MELLRAAYGDDIDRRIGKHRFQRAGMARTGAGRYRCRQIDIHIHHAGWREEIRKMGERRQVNGLRHWSGPCEADAEGFGRAHAVAPVK
jgi:hypothetical protein